MILDCDMGLQHVGRTAGERLVGESYGIRDARVLAAYLARYPTGVPFRTVGRDVQPVQHHQQPGG